MFPKSDWLCICLLSIILFIEIEVCRLAACFLLMSFTILSRSTCLKLVMSPVSDGWADEMIDLITSSVLSLKFVLERHLCFIAYGYFIEAVCSKCCKDYLFFLNLSNFYFSRFERILALVLICAVDGAVIYLKASPEWIWMFGSVYGLIKLVDFC